MSRNTSSKNNDLRSVRFETAIALFAGAIVSVIAFTIVQLTTTLSPIFSGLAVITFYVVYAALIWYFAEKKRRGKHDETLAPVMGRIMFDAVVKMSSPVFICDREERILWYNSATEALASSRNKLYGQLIAELFGVTLSDIRNDRSDKGARITCGDRSFLAKYNHIKTDDNDFALIVTTEITDYDALSAKMAGDELVVCYIIIDNMNEMLQYDSELYRPASVKIDEIIRDWADEYGGILKEYERD